MKTLISSRLTWSVTLNILLGFLLLTVRALWKPYFDQSYLFWNAFLACLPLLWAALVYFFSQRSSKVRYFFIFFLILWVLFLPNASYVFTDILHILNTVIYSRIYPLTNTLTSEHMPFWLDLAVYIHFALFCHMLGIFSLFIVEHSLKTRWKNLYTYIFLLLSVLLCGFGIYFGRFLRFNSWEFFTQTPLVLRHIGQIFFDLNAISFSLIYSSILLTNYALLRSLWLIRKGT